MSISIKNESFVHVVGTIDTGAGTGQILYVNPASVGVVGTEASGDPYTELLVEGDGGEELMRVHPAIRRDPCDADTNDGLIQHDLPYLSGMRRIRLLYKGDELAVFERPVETARTVPAGGLALGLAPPANRHRRLVDLPAVEEEPGVTYTVMVRPEGDDVWQTVKVGSALPAFELDANQFPGAAQATVRVLRSTGFQDEVIAEEQVDMEVK